MKKSPHHAMSLRIEPKIWNGVVKLAQKNNRAVNRQIELMLADGLGMYGLCPYIVVSGDNYYWVSQYGTYGELNKTTFKRLCSSGSTPLVADEWDDAFDTMKDCIKALGTPVCSYSDRGLTIFNYKAFEKLVMTYQG